MCVEEELTRSELSARLEVAEPALAIGRADLLAREALLGLPSLRAAVLLGEATAAKRRTHPLVWDYRFSMPGKCYHQSPMMSIVHSDVPNHPLMSGAQELSSVLFGAGPDPSRPPLALATHERT